MSSKDESLVTFQNSPQFAEVKVENMDLVYPDEVRQFFDFSLGVLFLIVEFKCEKTIELCSVKELCTASTRGNKIICDLNCSACSIHNNRRASTVTKLKYVKLMIMTLDASNDSSIS